MWEVTKTFKVKLGGNFYINVGTLVAFKGKPLFTLKRHDESGELGINFEIYDAKGKHVATVKRNQIYVGNKEDFEISGSADTYVLKEKTSGRVLCEIKKRGDAETELDVSVHLYTPSGFLFDATPERTNLGGVVLQNNTIVNSGTGIALS